APAVLLLVALAGPALGQEPPPPPAAPPPVADTSAEVEAAQELFARAVAEFDGPQQSRSIVIFEDAIARLEALRRQGPLTPRARDLLLQAYEYRGRAYFNIGLPDKASESFRAIVTLSPQYAISRDKVSPKIVEHFNAVKKALVGSLAVSSRPAGARVTLNGEFLALTDFFPLEVLAGDYTIEVARDGYKTETRTLSIAPRATETVHVDLTRTAASIFVITEPAGVEVWIDGQQRGSTGGTVGLELADAVRARGLDPARASARTEIANVTLGPHAVELRRKCYEPVKVALDTPEAADYEIPPARLVESLATLEIRSDPPGGRIFVDGEASGVTPRTLEGLCSGRHRIEVKHTAGKFVQDLTLEKDESVSLDAPIRASLAFLGVVAEGGSLRAVPDVEDALVRNLPKITTLNVLAAPSEVVDRILTGERLERRSLLPGSGVEPDAIRRATEKLAAALEVQGFLLASVPDERLQRNTMLHLLAAGNTVADRWEVAFRDPVSFGRFLAAVDRRAVLYRPWTGLVTVDTLLHEGVPVLRIVPGSPAAAAGVQAGEVLTAVGGAPVKQTADLRAAVEKAKPGDRLALQLKGASGARTVELALTQTPQEIPLNDAQLLYNKVMMDLRQQVEGYPGTEDAAFARLNLAIAAMHFADYAAAHEHLVKARAELPARPGLSQGTAAYYLGIAFERLGYRKEAAEAFRTAAGFKDATLGSNEGPAVAPLAQRRAGS
ncbi:MAG TPA: PEGA domain-containing protein, partial [Vicinamibacteria bacterium]|nr:PEGA domain-containing protein [Vicinamibacteria bacterium]